MVAKYNLQKTEIFLKKQIINKIIRYVTVFCFCGEDIINNIVLNMRDTLEIREEDIKLKESEVI